MNTQVISALVDALGWTLVHFLWQGAAVAAALWICLATAGNASPRLRHALAGIALASMCLLAASTFWKYSSSPVGASPSLVAMAGGETGAAGTAAAVPAPVPAPIPALPPVSEASPRHNPFAPFVHPAAHRPFSSKLRPALPWLVGIWSIGVLVFGCRLARSWVEVRTWKRRGTVPKDTRCLRHFQNLCSALKIRRPVRLLVSATATVPMVIGWLKPVVLVPAGIFAGLPSAQIEAILAHELAHVRRGDYLVNLLQVAFETVFFYHPAVWWVGAQIRKEREHCCDDTAAALSGGPADYANALTALEEFRGSTPALGVAANGGSLLGRIHRLANSDEPSRPVWPVMTLIAIAATGIVLAASSRADGPGSAPSNPGDEAKAKAGEVAPLREKDHDGDTPWILSLDAHQAFIETTGKKIANITIYPDGKTIVSTRRQFFHEYIEGKFERDEIEALLRWLAKDPKTHEVDAGISKVDALRSWRKETAKLKGSDEGAAVVAFQLDGKTYLRKIKATDDPVFDRLFDDVLPKAMVGEKKGAIEDPQEGADAGGPPDKRPDVATGEPRSAPAGKGPGNLVDIYQLTKRDHSAMWFYSEGEKGPKIHLVLYYKGWLQNGVSYTEYDDKSWLFDGFVRIPSGRKIRIRFSSKDPGKIEIDGKVHDVPHGDIFAIYDEGEPVRQRAAPPAMVEENLKFIAKSVAARERS